MSPRWLRQRPSQILSITDSKCRRADDDFLQGKIKILVWQDDLVFMQRLFSDKRKKKCCLHSPSMSIMADKIHSAQNVLIAGMRIEGVVGIL